MDRQGKMASGFKNVLKTVSSFGRRPNTSSPASDGLSSKLLLDSADLPAKESKARGRSQNGFSRNLRDVPKGHLPVYVGKKREPKRERFVIKVEYLSLDFIKELLDSDKISCIQRPGGLTLDCEPALFKMMLQGIESGHFDSKRVTTQ